MRRFHRPSAALLLLALITNTACYAYQPSVGLPRAGDTVRFELTAAGETELARFLGPNVREVTGDLVDVRPTGVLVVAPQWVKTSNGGLQAWSGEGTVEFPRALVRSLDERMFSGRRTTITAATVTAGLVSIALIALKSGGAHGAVAAGGGTPVR